MRKINKKYLTGAIIAIVILSAIGYFWGKPIIKFITKPEVDYALIEVSDKFNKQCPIMLDEETRIDNTIALPDNVFQYYTTLINIDKSTIDIQELKAQIEPRIIYITKTNPIFKGFQEYKTTIKYYYKDKNGAYLFTISVTPYIYNR